MEFERVTKTFEIEGVQFELWLNPPRRLLRELFSSETEVGARTVAANLLGIEPDDFDDMPYTVAQALLGVGDHKGLVWAELDAYRDEILKNFGGGLGSSATE